MSAALWDQDRVYSREEYYRWYGDQSCGRFERVNGRIVAMAPERVAHVRVKAAAFLALRRAVAAAGIACEAFPDGLAIHTGDNDFEPDALVNCGGPIDDNAIAAPNPVVVVEVISPGTKSVDTGVKLIGYFDVPSVAHYLIIDPIRPVIVHHRRAADGILTRIVRQGAIDMDPPGITVTVQEIYEAAPP